MIYIVVKYQIINYKKKTHFSNWFIDPIHNNISKRHFVNRIKCVLILKRLTLVAIKIFFTLHQITPKYKTYFCLPMHLYEYTFKNKKFLFDLR